MLFEQIASGGCRSYLVGCEDSCAAVLIDPELRQIDRYRALAARDGLRTRYVIDTHTHADHFSAAHRIGQLLADAVIPSRRVSERSKSHCAALSARSCRGRWGASR